MPWESQSCELHAMQIAEVSTSVHSFLAQPHRLELRVLRCKRPLLYLPDMQMEVDEKVAAGLMRGDAFGPALMAATAGAGDLTQPEPSLWSSRAITTVGWRTPNT